MLRRGRRLLDDHSLRRFQILSGVRLRIWIVFRGGSLLFPVASLRLLRGALDNVKIGPLEEGELRGHDLADAFLSRTFVCGQRDLLLSGLWRGRSYIILDIVSSILTSEWQVLLVIDDVLKLVLVTGDLRR